MDFDDVYTQHQEAYLTRLEDERYNRWRDPVIPERVVYPIDGTTCVVWDEVTMDTNAFHISNLEEKEESYRIGFQTARRYFEDHPPQPWHKAEPASIWACTLRQFPTEKIAAIVTRDGEFMYIDEMDEIFGSLPLTSPLVLDAVLIWSPFKPKND